jgi:glyoxylase-like metal-dependent hydrolase (beta-lactamase superfamily II)
VHSDLPTNSVSASSQGQGDKQAQSPSKPPRIVFQSHHDRPHTVFAFPPNRGTLGGTAYFILDEVNILVDCPVWDETNRSFFHEQGGVDWLFLTHRGGISKVREIQQELGCKVLIQEQEAYLLPEVDKIQFEQEFTLTPQAHVIWTPGHSPGSSCLYYDRFGGVLFSGRHLLPNPMGELRPIQTAKTFHWRRQLRSVQRLIDKFTPDTLEWICPGANIGFLRGKYAIEEAYKQLLQIDKEYPNGCV